MNLENNIKDVITKQLESGVIEKLIAEQLENGIKNALKDLLGTYGDVTKVIEKQIKSVMVPYLESYDYSRYITKLDSVMVEVLKSSSLENKKLLDNFQKLILPGAEKEIKVSDLFNTWIKYVAENVETDGLEIDYDDEPSYECVEVRFEVQEDEDREWSSFKYASLVFECDHDKEMNFVLRLSKYKNENWDIRYDKTSDIKSLRHLNDFEVLLMNLDQNGTKLILDATYDNEDVRPEKQPEASYE